MKQEKFITPVRGLKSVALAGIVVLAIGLAAVNVLGAWHASGGDKAYTFMILGGELFLTVGFALLLMSPGRWFAPHKVIGSIVLCALIYVCVSNGKVGIKQALADIFTADVATLEANISLYSDEAKAASERANELRADARARADAAADLYSKSVVSATKAVEDKEKELREQADKKDSEALDFKRKIIEAQAQAELIRWKEVWLNIILVAAEGARTFGLWAFILWDNRKKAVKSIIIDGEEIDIDFIRDAVKHRRNHLDGVEKRKAAPKDATYEDPEPIPLELPAPDAAELEQSDDEGEQER